MDLALEELVGHGAADEGGGNVVEEAGDDEDHDQQDETALPVVGQELGQDDRDVALFEMAGKKREAGEQAEESGDGHPFVAEVAEPAGDAKPGLEAGEYDLVQADGDQPGECNVEGGVMEQRHTEQGQ